ncbi:hypothetical protein EV194_102239 [Natronoflexus pectinivorans]|uniref:Uncharacterized protein n=2 Tax=Natronoflexus pectinivorans TaxID=682526 RepID=A0A4R2GM25_9BACT|nr:hypothetical protein EV194_102239 [Natronoflexus pectinivorans]
MGSLFFVAFSGSLISLSAQGSPEAPVRIKSWIEIREISDQYTFTGKLINYEELELPFDYRLKVVRQSSSGTSQSNQAGSVTALPGMVTQLSYSSINCNKDEKWEAILLIYYKHQMVAGDTIRNKEMR